MLGNMLLLKVAVVLKKMNNIELYDTRNIIDLKKIHEDFNHLSKDNYQHNSHNFNNTANYYYNGITITKKESYNQYNTLHSEELSKILTLFIQLSKTPSHRDITIEAKRVITTPSISGKPSVKGGWHQI